MTHPPWVALQAWLSFIELDKAVVLVWLDWLVFCEYGFSVSALWCPLATPSILLGFLLPWTCGISSGLLQQSTATAPYLGWGVTPHCCPSWPKPVRKYSRSHTTRLFRTNTQKRWPFHYRGLECKSRKLRNTWSKKANLALECGMKQGKD